MSEPSNATIVTVENESPGLTLLEAGPGEAMRRVRGRVMEALCWASAAIVLLPLASILLYVVQRGLKGVSLSFFTHLPAPVGEVGGGMGNAIAGTLVLVAIGSAIGLPIGVLAGVYLAQVGRGRLASAIRFMTDVLGGVPSISIGVFVYAIFVVSMRRFSAIAGGVSLAIVMLPTVTRTTEEMLRLVPWNLYEAALALGVPPWRATLKVVLRTALPGVATGIMLAVARISGETAPLLFTALSSRFWPDAIDRPIASLPVQILNYATSPYDDWQQQAWTGALVLVTLVLGLNITARTLAARASRGAQ
jgi:phosphate transport system permease protein